MAPFLHGPKSLSDVCKHRARTERRHPRTPAACRACLGDFMALVAVVRTGRPIFCSARCAGAYAKVTGRFAGANNPRWLGGVSSDNMRYRRRQKERHPIEEAARRAVARAVRAGRLTRQPCESCGDLPAQGHHDDYSKPLDVRWLCRACHDEHHRVSGR